MCELFALSSRFPVNANFSLGTFTRRGGETGPHGDGWGVAFFEGRDARVIREPAPAAESDCVRFLETHDIRSTLVLSHVRLATRGAVALRNTQPFARELGGRLHVFAHNGKLEDIENQPWTQLGRRRPIGETDSEVAFCALLSTLEALWLRNGSAPPILERLEAVATFARRIRPLGPANFIYSDGDALFAHGHRRTQEDGTVAPPGLHLLRRTCREPVVQSTGGVTLRSETVDQSVVLLASRPLTEDEAWQPLAEGEVVAVHRGQLVANQVVDEQREWNAAASAELR